MSFKSCTLKLPMVSFNGLLQQQGKQQQPAPITWKDNRQCREQFPWLSAERSGAELLQQSSSRLG